MVHQITNATLYISRNSLDTSKPYRSRSSQGRAAHLVMSKIGIKGAIERDSFIDGEKLRDISR